MNEKSPPAPDEPRDESREVPIEEAESAESTEPTGSPEPGPEERIAELEDKLKRTQAEFVNESKRIRRQTDDRIRYAKEGLVEDLLPVFDALHSARDGFAAAAVSDESAKAALDGFDLVERELLNVLNRHGVVRIEAGRAVSFDPSLHHAIVMMDVPELTPGAIAKELRPGFQLHDRVVRPAHVAVVASREDEAETDDGEEE